MSQSIEVQIAEHMKTVLANANLSATVVPIDETRRVSLSGPDGSVVRTYLPEYALEESDQPRISLLLFNSEMFQFTRASWQEDYFIDAIVHRRVSDPTQKYKRPTPDDVRVRQEVWRDNVTVYGDSIMYLAQEVQIVFEANLNRRVSYDAPGTGIANSCAVWLQASREASYQRAQIEEKHVIFSIIRNLWRTYRDVASNG